MANTEHLELLKQGAEIWNDWRKRNVTVAIDFTGADLKDLDLSEFELFVTDFTGANLSGTSIGNNLSHSNFTDVDLTKTKFSAPRFFQGNLTRANLSRTGFHRANFTHANLNGANLTGVYFADVYLDGADLTDANLTEIKIGKYGLALPKRLTGANFTNVNLSGMHFAGANLVGGIFSGARLIEANFAGSDLTGADFSGAVLVRANFVGSTLTGANFSGTRYGVESGQEDSPYGRSLKGPDRYYTHHYVPAPTLIEADFTDAILRNVNFTGVNLNGANLTNADLTGSILKYASLVEVNVEGSTINDCSVYGLSAWGLKGTPKQQRSLIITSDKEIEITVDNLQLAQFLYLVIDNRNFREIIDTITRKVVLILGRFTPERKAILDTLRNELRNHNYLSVLFDFDGPISRSITETVSTLAHLSRFVIADITDPKSIPQELTVIVKALTSVPIKPILLNSQREYGMFNDLEDYPWLLEPFHYESLDEVVNSLSEKIILPAEEWINKREERKAFKKGS